MNRLDTSLLSTKLFLDFSSLMLKLSLFCFSWCSGFIIDFFFVSVLSSKDIYVCEGEDLLGVVLYQDHLPGVVLVLQPGVVQAKEQLLGVVQEEQLLRVVQEEQLLGVVRRSSCCRLYRSSSYSGLYRRSSYCGLYRRNSYLGLYSRSSYWGLSGGAVTVGCTGGAVPWGCTGGAVMGGW